LIVADLAAAIQQQTVCIKAAADMDFYIVI
jgi:hypothetical protein